MTETSKTETPKRERGTGSLYLVGPYWHYKFYSRFGAHRESSRSTDRKVAERMLKRKLAEVTTKTYVPRANVRIDELITDMLAEYKQQRRKSIESARKRWKNHLEPFFTKLRADDLNTDLVQKYCAQRQTEEASGATLNRELAILKRAFKLAMKRTPPKVQRVPIMPSFRESDARTGFLEDAQYELLAREASREGLWLRSLLTVAYSFAFRKGELLSMRVKQIDLSSQTIRLEGTQTKNGTGRTIRMTPEVQTLLTALTIGKQPDDFVFTRENGSPVKGFRKIWKTICTRAGVPELLFHDLRRSGVRNLVRLGVPEGVAMKISGHKTRSVFERYNIVSEADLADAASRLSAKQNAAALEFGQSLGSMAENKPQNNALTAPHFAAAHLPN